MWNALQLEWVLIPLNLMILKKEKTMLVFNAGVSQNQHLFHQNVLIMEVIVYAMVLYFRWSKMVKMDQIISLMHSMLHIQSIMPITQIALSVAKRALRESTQLQVKTKSASVMKDNCKCLMKQFNKSRRTGEQKKLRKRRRKLSLQPSKRLLRQKLTPLLQRRKPQLT